MRGFWILSLLYLLAAASLTSAAASYTPDVDRVVLVIGQNVESVTNYTSTLGHVPGGIMSYTSTANAEGLNTSTSYGAGLIHAQHFVANPTYSNTVIQMGLYINGDLVNITNGTRNANITTIGNWIKNTGRPVYLRIGYEFDNPGNALPPDQYIAAYRYLVDRFRTAGVTNAAYVWNSWCAPTYNNNPVSTWYPGDDYVDWAGISVFQQFSGTLGTVAHIDVFCAFAKSRNKPIMIAESTPYGGISNARWTNWFLPCLELIGRHHIQMWCYINADWEALPLFAGQGWGDTRIQQNPFVKSNWLAAVNDTTFLKKSSELYPRLHVNSTNRWFEAESGELNGVSPYADNSASGNTAVTSLNNPGDSVIFTNAGPAMQFVLRYAATNNGTIGLYVNSQSRRSIPISSTGQASGSGAYRDLLVHAAIPNGATVRFQYDVGDVAPNLDWVLFRNYPDTDEDGLPDDWERWRFGSLTNNASDDPDGDHSRNYDEFAADTEPLNSASAFRITSLVANAGAATVAVQPLLSRDCFLQQSTNLLNWAFTANVHRNSETNVSLTLSNLPPAKAFWRAEVP